MSHVLATKPQMIAEAQVSSWPVGSKGIVTKDADGYYCGLLAGALGTYNSSKELYRVNDVIIDNLLNKSIMAEKLKKKVLYVEYGHPKRFVKNQDGTTTILDDKTFASLLINTSDRSVCGHVRNVRIAKATTKDKYGNLPYLIYMDIKADGPFAHIFEQRMESSSVNACLSMRWFADSEEVNGVTVKTVFETITVDLVGEGGIELCTKDNFLSFEEKRPRVVITEDVLATMRSEHADKKDSSESSEIIQVLNAIETNRNRSSMPGSFYM